jgi:hypothetical protein
MLPCRVTDQRLTQSSQSTQTEELKHARLFFSVLTLVLPDAQRPPGVSPTRSCSDPSLLAVTRHRDIGEEDREYLH